MALKRSTVKIMYCSYRWCTSPSVVQLGPLCFQVLTEGLLEWWSHFGHRPDIHIHTERQRKEKRGRTLIHLPLQQRSYVEPKTEALDSEHLFPIKASKSSSWGPLFPWTLPKVLTHLPVNPASFVRAEGPILHVGPILEPPPPLLSAVSRSRQQRGMKHKLFSPPFILLLSL